MAVLCSGRWIGIPIEQATRPLRPLSVSIVSYVRCPRAEPRVRLNRSCCGCSCALSVVVPNCSSTTSGKDLVDDGQRKLLRSASRRKTLLVSALAPLLTTFGWFGDLQAAPLPEEEAVRLEKIRDEVVKAVSKGKAAGVLRLVFHDAGTYNMGTNTGGMNGSIIYELERPESAGLKRSVRVLEKVRITLEPEIKVSWADLIAVAGAESVAICGGPEIRVRLGRLDSLLPDPEGEMPEEYLNAIDLKNNFRQKGFSTQEMIALSGAHTIGNKGFGMPDLFDNAYYKTLMEKPWVISKGGDMMSMVGLTSDRNLTDDIECMKWVELYAGNQDRFFGDFNKAFIKLVNVGAQWT